MPSLSSSPTRPICTLLFVVAVGGAVGLRGPCFWEPTRSAQAYEGGGAGVVPPSDQRSRATWAGLLGGYVALGALATGAAYLWRDNLVGRTVAVSAAGWGGLGVGAGAAYGLVHLRGCQSADCTGEEEVAIAIGGMLGTIAATIAGHLVTSEPGLSRPYTAVAGLAPALLFFSVGTVVDW